MVSETMDMLAQVSKCKCATVQVDMLVQVATV
jgi:hypothetical protein